ncbi:hypothetical protein C0991_005302 [Blastosporella zonata]|nr:hypothetical protein C0991_005302 [Blastosporella zonata]
MDNSDDTVSSEGEPNESFIWDAQQSDLSTDSEDSQPYRNPIFDLTPNSDITQSSMSPPGSQESSRIDIRLPGSPSVLVNDRDNQNVSGLSQSDGDMTPDSPTSSDFLPLELNARRVQGSTSTDLAAAGILLDQSPNTSSVGEGSASMSFTSIYNSQATDLAAAGILLDQSPNTSSVGEGSASMSFTSIYNSQANRSQPSSGAPSPAKSVKSRGPGSPAKSIADDGRPSSRVSSSTSRRDRSISSSRRSENPGGQLAYRRDSISSIGSFHPPLIPGTFDGLKVLKTDIVSATLQERVRNFQAALKKAEDSLKEEKVRAAAELKKAEDRAAADMKKAEDRAAADMKKAEDSLKEEKARAAADMKKADDALKEEKARGAKSEAKAEKMLEEEKARGAKSEAKAEKMLEEEKERLRKMEARVEKAEARADKFEAKAEDLQAMLDQA